MQIAPTDALIYIMVLTASADREATDRELDRIGALTSRWPVFADFDTGRLAEVAGACVDLLNKGGLDALLERIAAALEPRLQETGYALAVEVATADLALNQEELRLLEMIRDSFEIDRLTTAAIEASARIRHRRL